MSTGLPCDQVTGNTLFNFAKVSSDKVAMTNPRSTAQSVAITPGPPPLVTIAKRLPVGLNPQESAFAAENSCVIDCTRTTPARRTAASKASSDPTKDAVCDIAALEPAGCLPTFTRITGFTRAAARIALIKLRASRMPSM